MVTKSGYEINRLRAWSMSPMSPVLSQKACTRAVAWKSVVRVMSSGGASPCCSAAARSPTSGAGRYDHDTEQL
jgi:hypothetical protein